MKRKTFLKRLSLALFTVAMFFGTLIALSSCDEYIPPLPECEAQNTGTIIIKNQTGITAKVDVDNIDERIISGYGQTTYHDVPAGSHRMYIDIGYGWQYNVEYLSQCETLTYRWYLTTSKSTNQILLLDITRDGVTQTYTEDELDLVFDLERIY